MTVENNFADVFDLRTKHKISSADMHAFMRQNFYAKECSKYTPRVRQKISLDDFIEYCACGGTLGDHVASLQEQSDDPNWTEADIIKIQTNAFGKIKFINTDSYQKPAKYARIADDSKINDVIDLIKYYWSMTHSKPELVISVMGSGKAFNVTSSLRKKIFNRGLIPAIEATGGWITTFGSNIGVAKAVGEAVRDGQYFYEENGQVRRTLQCIGIAPWGSVRDRDLLVNSPENILEKEINIADYSADSIVRSGKPTSLNPYHTHFLLVDDGHRNKERGVASFRANLEKRISASEADGGLNIPVVCILIEGGANSIEYLVHSVSSGLPVLVCQGSGRAADVVAFAYRRYKLCKVDQNEELNEEDYEVFKTELRRKIEKTFYPNQRGDFVSKRVVMLMHELIQICEKTDLVYIYDVNRKENLDTAILLCLLECQRSNKQDSRTQLHLALHWNRADVAKAKIFSSDVHWKDEELRGHFLEALIGEKLDFIKLFVDHGFSVKRYLTVAELRKIYTLSVTDSTFLWHLLKYDTNVTPPEEIYLVEIYNLMQRLTRRFGHPDYVNDCKYNGRDFYTFEKPFQELFLWAILLNRVESAKYFWEQCDDPLVVALGGTFVCLCLAQKAENFSTELEQQFLAAKDTFESNAKGLIDQAFESNKEKAMVLVSVRSVLWGNLDCMELAALADSKDFLASSCCQTLIFRKWKKDYEATGWEIVVCTFTMLPILRMVQFADETAHYHESNYGYRSLMCDYQHFYTGTNSYIGPVPLSARKSSSPSINFAQRYSVVFPPPRKSNISKSVSHDGSTRRRKKLRWYRKVYKFYTSPVVKFTNHVFWYFLFLVLHCYVLLFSFRWPFMSIPEMVLHIWTFTYFCEVLRSIVTYPATTFLNKFEDWWYYSGFAIWNRLDIICIFISLLVFIFRWFAPLFAIARLLLALNFITYMFRIYKIFMVNSYLGPKVVMIKRMSRDLAMFLLIVAVLMVSYSVASQALLHPHRSFYSGIFFDIFIHGIWELFGELNDEVTKGNVPECQSPINETILGFTGECGMRVWPTAILLAVYLFFGNILLVNMLIAIFASVFTDVQSHSEQIWKSLMYFLVTEYDKKPMLPPPFIILEHVFFIFRWCYKCGRKKNYNAVHVPKGTEASLIFLNVFELVCRSEYLEKRKQADQSATDLLLIQLNENCQKITYLLPGLTVRNVRLLPENSISEITSRSGEPVMPGMPGPMAKAMAAAVPAMHDLDVEDGYRVEGRRERMMQDEETEIDNEQASEDILFH